MRNYKNIIAWRKADENVISPKAPSQKRYVSLRDRLKIPVAIAATCLIVSFTLFSCVGQKHMQPVMNSKGFRLNVHKSANFAKNRKFLIKIKLLYATLLSKSGEIVGAYASERRMLEHQECINNTIAKGGILIYGSDFEIEINGQTLAGEVMAVEVDNNCNVINIYRKEELPELNYIDRDGVSWQEDTFGNVEIIKLINKETGNEILLNSRFIARFYEDLKNDLKSIDGSILSIEGSMVLLSYYQQVRFHELPPGIATASTKDSENYLKMLQGWGGRTRRLELERDNYTGILLIDMFGCNFYHSTEELPRWVKKVKKNIVDLDKIFLGPMRKIFGLKKKSKLRVIRLTGIESGGQIYDINQERVIFGKLSMQKAIKFAEQEMSNFEQTVIGRQLDEFIGKEDL